MAASATCFWSAFGIRLRWFHARWASTGCCGHNCLNHASFLHCTAARSGVRGGGGWGGVLGSRKHCCLVADVCAGINFVFDPGGLEQPAAALSCFVSNARITFAVDWAALKTNYPSIFSKSAVSTESNCRTRTATRRVLGARLLNSFSLVQKLISLLLTLNLAGTCL